ncbi:MAG: hypothetical protein ACLPP9_04845 [Smithella sp.]
MKYTIVLIFLLVGVICMSGCTSSGSASTTAQATIVPTQSPGVMTPTQITPTAVQPTTQGGCVLTETGCTPLPPSPTVPPIGNETLQNDSIIGTYVFDLSQFNSNDVERLDYFSSIGSSEYDYKVVPLDISPDIKWTFRDDGVLLFFQNNITCSNDSLRSAWKISNGVYMRNGIWKRLESGNDGITYQVNRENHIYTVIYDNNEVRLTQPTMLNMTKIN